MSTADHDEIDRLLDELGRRLRDRTRRLELALADLREARLEVITYKPRLQPLGPVVAWRDVPRFLPDPPTQKEPAPAS